MFRARPCGKPRNRLRASNYDSEPGAPDRFSIDAQQARGGLWAATPRRTAVVVTAGGGRPGAYTRPPPFPPAAIISGVMSVMSNSASLLVALAACRLSSWEHVQDVLRGRGRTHDGCLRLPATAAAGTVTCTHQHAPALARCRRHPPFAGRTWHLPPRRCPRAPGCLPSRRGGTPAHSPSWVPPRGRPARLRAAHPQTRVFAGVATQAGHDMQRPGAGGTAFMYLASRRACRMSWTRPRSPR